ncbi:MAG: hypothetical protein ACHQFW_05800 [Chitinophagales bacterium]
MRIAIFFFVISTLGAGNLMAQSSTDNRKDDIPDKYSDQEIAWARERTEMLDDQVNLTEAQKKEVMKINLKSADKYDRMMDKDLTEAEMDAYRDKMFDKRMKSYNRVLTPAQEDKLQAQKNNIKDKEVNQDKVERNQRIREKAKSEGYTKDDVMDKKEKRDDKKETAKKDEVKSKAKSKDVSKKEAKEKKKRKDDY